MRAYECLLTAEAKTALFEVVRAMDHPVTIGQTGEREEWHIGGGVRYEWCIFWKKAETDLWNVTFGGNLKKPEILEPLFVKTIAQVGGCTWIWPERKNSG